MKLPRRKFLHLAAALPAFSRVAWAQAYPTRPVRIIVGVPPGGGIDMSGSARIPRTVPVARPIGLKCRTPMCRR